MSATPEQLQRAARLNDLLAREEALLVPQRAEWDELAEEPGEAESPVKLVAAALVGLVAILVLCWLLPLGCAAFTGGVCR